MYGDSLCLYQSLRIVEYIGVKADLLVHQLPHSTFSLLLRALTEYDDNNRMGVVARLFLCQTFVLIAPCVIGRGR